MTENTNPLSKYYRQPAVYIKFPSGGNYPPHVLERSPSGEYPVLPMGQLVKTMLESGVKLGVSSRGSGNMNEYGSGEVSDFEIITVDVVAQPSAPGAYPTPIYEHLLNTKGGMKAKGLAEEVRNDKKAQRYLKDALTNIIKDLK